MIHFETHSTMKRNGRIVDQLRGVKRIRIEVRYYMDVLYQNSTISVSLGRSEKVILSTYAVSCSEETIAPGEAVEQR